MCVSGALRYPLCAAEIMWLYNHLIDVIIVVSDKVKGYVLRRTSPTRSVKNRWTEPLGATKMLES
jgi:hypothetical protein